MQTDFDICSYSQMQAEEEISFFREEDCLGGQQTETAGWGWKALNEAEKDDSMDYIEQFLNFDRPTLYAPCDSLPPSCEDSPQIGKADPATKSQLPVRRQKKGKKVENSPFHNYQKHLNNALKKLIIVPAFPASEEPYKLAAQDIWRRYLSMEVKTKRVLHFVFNERNEHSVNEPELRTYGLLEIHQRYGQDVVSQAKNYISKLAIDQIDEPNLEGYLRTRKIKRMDGLKHYILSFKAELETGYLKRRINLEQTP